MKWYQKSTLLCVVIFSISEAATTGKFNIDDSRKIIGVSSVAGVTSRNGRVSSIGGIRFYHAPDTLQTGSVQPPEWNYQPIAIAEAGKGRAASASVHYYPNSVVVSSSAGSGNVHQANSWFPKIPTINNIFQSPKEILEHARSFHQWLPRDLFEYIPHPSTQFKEAWSYPNFNPFESFWR